MPRGLIDHESFLKLEPAAQENLLRQALLLWLTALDHAGRDPDAWEAEAFTAAIELLAMQAPRTAYRDVERMLLSPSERPSSDRPSSERPAPQVTRILRVDMSEGAHAPPPQRETPDRRMLRRRLLQLSTLQPALDPAEARPSAATHLHRNVESRSEGDEAGDD
jgi:hypothetical protein